MARKDGGPAFARPGIGQDDVGAEEGMSLRDYFAAKAMQAFIAKIPALEVAGRDGCGKTSLLELKEMRMGVAVSAYECADAMLYERSVAR